MDQKQGRCLRVIVPKTQAFPTPGPRSGSYFAYSIWASLLIGDLINVRPHLRPNLLKNRKLLFEGRQSLLNETVLDVRTYRLDELTETVRLGTQA